MGTKTCPAESLNTVPSNSVSFIVPLALTAAYAVRNGAEVLARVNSVLLPMTILIVLLLIAFLLPVAKTDNLLPLIDVDIPTLLKSAHGAAMFPFSQSVVFLMMLPRLTRGKRATKSILSGVILSGLLLTAVSLRNISVLGAAVDNSVYPSHFAARLVAVNTIIHALLKRAMGK